MGGGLRRGMRRDGGPALLAGLAVAAVLATTACRPADRDADASAPWTPELARELVAMEARDQAVREGFGEEAARDTAFLARMARTDSALSLRLRELVERHGWPRASEVGEEAVHAAFLVVQHTPFREWQRAMLPHVQQASEAGELDGQSFALLFDRVRMHEGRPQRYGTQFSGGEDGVWRLHTLEDTAAVDSLRATVGLPPLEAYLELVEAETGLAVEWEDAAS